MFKVLKVYSIVALTMLLLGSEVSVSGYAEERPSPERRSDCVALTITSPADGAVFAKTKIPLAIKISPRRDDDAHLKVYLNGEDISEHFSSPDAEGTRRATLEAPDVLFGKNQVTVKAKGAVAKSRFYVDLRGGATPAANPSLYVPITTRVIHGDPAQAQSYSIRVGDVYWPAPAAPDGSATGFQILLLSRADYSEQVNMTVGTADGWSALEDALNPASQLCPVTVGCIEIVQSLASMGLTPCGTGTATC